MAESGCSPTSSASRVSPSVCAVIGQDHSQTEQNGFAMRVTRIIGQDGPVKRHRRRRVHEGRQAAVVKGVGRGVLAQEISHAHAEIVAGLHEMEIGQAETDLAAGGGFRVSLEESQVAFQRGGARRARAGFVFIAIGFHRQPEGRVGGVQGDRFALGIQPRQSPGGHIEGNRPFSDPDGR